MKEKKINIARPRHSNEMLQSTACTQMQEAGGCHWMWLLSVCPARAASSLALVGPADSVPVPVVSNTPARGPPAEAATTTHRPMIRPLISMLQLSAFYRDANNRNTPPHIHILYPPIFR